MTLHEYASGTVFARHTHARGQFAYASTGALKMFTDLGNWVVPPQRALWMPAGIVALALSPLLGWSRLRMARHTLPEVTGGATLGVLGGIALRLVG